MASSIIIGALVVNVTFALVVDTAGSILVMVSLFWLHELLFTGGDVD